MKKRIVRVSVITFLFLLLVVPAIIFGQKIIEKFITPTKTMFSELDNENKEMDMPNGSSADKAEYIRLRDEQIALIRGLPMDKGDERIKAIQKMENQEKSRADKNAAAANWRYLGPSPIPVTVPTSGRVSAIAVHPTNPDIAYVGAAQGGLYRTLNGGVTWTPLLDNALTLSIGAVAISPSDPTTVFVGTGESAASQDSYFGVGIYKITNADTSPVVSAPIGSAEFTGRSISEILVHPTDSNIIFASSTSGTCGMGGCGGAPAPATGIYRSTNALAATPTFQRILNGSIMDLVMEPGVPDNILCWVRSTVGTGGVYRSTNALAATPTFSLTYASVTNSSRGELAIQKTGASVTVIAATGDAAGGSTQGAVFKSTDGGITFPTQLTGGNNFCNPQCFYDIAIAIDPNNANNVYLAGSPTAVFRRSFDGGASFSASSSGLHVDTHAITVAPSNPNIIYYGSDGGIYRTTNPTTTPIVWSSLNNSTFAATQFQSIALHPSLTNYTLGGTQDNGTLFLTNDGTSWVSSDGGDGGYVVIDQNAVGISNVVAYHTYFNQTNSQIGYTKATTTVPSNGDPNWGTFFGCGGTANGISCADSTLFYAPMVGGPGTPINSLYFGTNKLYRSGDQGVTMTPVSQTFGSVVSTIAIAKLDDNVRLIGLANGTVFATATGSTTLTQMTGAFPARYVGRTAIDPSNANTGYVTFSGYNVAAGQHVFKTTNLNAATPTWAPAGNGIPDVPVNAFAIDPANSNNLFAGTDIGVYRSTDGGANWLPMNNGQLPRVAVFDMAIQPTSRILRIATHGRGIWEFDLNAVATKPYIDFDGDSKTDVSIFRPSLGQWWYLRSSDSTNRAFSFGASTDKLAAADYTGDGKTDIAVFRPSTGEWIILRSEDSSFFAFPFGTTGDVSVPSDYDGDGKADPAIFRPSAATWFISKSTGGTTIQGFGTSTDLPVPSDYDGDGKSDLAIYRANGANQEWWYQRSTNASVFATVFGVTGDKAVRGDYTGDGKTDIAVFRPSTGNWFVLRSEDLSFYSFPYGASGDIPAPGDYDGDGKFDAAVFRPTNVTWFINGSTSGTQIVGFGSSGDFPVPNYVVP